MKEDALAKKTKDATQARAERKGGVRTGQLNVRCSEVARWILEELQEHLGLSQSSILEMLLREEARRRGMIIPGSGADRARREAEAERLRQIAATRQGGVLD